MTAGATARVIAAFLLVALTWAPSNASTNERQILIPCQTATGAFVKPSPPSARNKLCDVAWMKAAKEVACPTNIARLHGSCYLHPSGVGVGMYTVAHPGGEEVLAVWCRVDRSAGDVECDRPVKPEAVGLGAAPRPGPTARCARRTVSVKSHGAFSTITIPETPPSPSPPVPHVADTGSALAPIVVRPLAVIASSSVTYEVPNARNGKPILPVPTPGPCASAKLHSGR